MNRKINMLEEALINSMPSLQTILVNGWVVRMNKNYTYRANCVCPLLYNNSNADDVHSQIHICEELLISNKLPPVFKVTPALQDGLAEILLTRGYKNVKTVNVMLCKIDNIGADSFYEIRSLEKPDNEWCIASSKLAGLVQPDLIDVHCQNLRSIAVKGIFVKVIIGSKIVGCGYGTIERGCIGIYDLHVDVNFRRRGIGTAICQSILHYGIFQNAKYAYLIVNSKNKNAISLYAQMGFREVYSYNFYCKPNSIYKIVDA
mgnify:CR=1 FL=1